MFVHFCWLTSKAGYRSRLFPSLLNDILAVITEKVHDFLKLWRNSRQANKRRV